MTNKFAEAAAKAVKDGKVAEHDREGGGDFAREVPAKGQCLGRLVTYVEVGTHPQKPYQGKARSPAPEAVLQFELYGKNHRKEITYQDEHGKDVTKVVHPLITIRIAIKEGSRSGYTKLLNALDYGRGNAIIPMMLGDAYKLTVIHNEIEKDGKKIVYANLKDKEGVWRIEAPIHQKVDPETMENIGEPRVLNPQQPNVELSCLMWDAPDIDQWNSIHIAGTYTRKEGDKEVEVSKNWMQETCKSALNWEGSAVATLVASLAGDLPDLDTTGMEDELPSNDDDIDLGTETPEIEESPSDASDIEPAGDLDDDPLAGLDLED